MSVVRLLAAMLAMATATVAARADPVADFYSGKTVTIYVGFGPGGGYDAYAQLLGQHIRRHIPGEPTVIVKHMPGAGSLVLMNYLWSVAPRDGTAFGIPASSAAFAPLIGSPQEKTAAKFDAAKFTWLGSLEKFTPIGIAWHTTGIKTIDDVKARPLRFGSSGAASGGELYAQLLNDLLGTKLVSIRGYRGSSDITLAIERGELDGFVGWC
jgi:tripartite-type tricarboxylate transporter receptor subunit TctC